MFNRLTAAARLASFGLGLTLILSAATPTARAAFEVPEVDPGSLASVMTLLAGGVMTLTGRARRAK